MENKIKFRAIFNIFMILISASCIILSNLEVTQSGKDYILGFGVGLLTVSIYSFIKNIYTLKNPNKLKQVRIAETDERNIEIINKSYALTFRITILIEGFICIIITMIGDKFISVFLGYILALQMLIFFIIYKIISKKI